MNLRSKTRRALLLFCLGLTAAGADAQYLKSGQIEVGNTGAKFRVSGWSAGGNYSDDDNFFISRVKPRARFYNAATQVNKKLKPWWMFKNPSGQNVSGYGENYSKKLLMWTPIGSKSGVNSPFTTIPDGLYNEEMFTMWQYVTTWGSWNDDFMRVPGNFVDVAHKNGVAVTTQASPSYQTYIDGYDLRYSSYDENRNWLSTFKDMNNNIDNTLAYLDWFGLDGVNYNSEWTPRWGSGELEVVKSLNNAIARHFDEKYRKNGRFASFSPENVWYDGINGQYQRFDNGLDVYSVGGQKNYTGDTSGFFGDSTSTADNKRTSFFFNYNWNGNTESSGYGGRDYLDKSVTKAISMGRNPFDLYAGFNLQSKEPYLTGTNNGTWPYVDKRAVSIGLWSGHDANMFWESRNSLGSNPETAQTTYQKALERWFTNSKGNPSAELEMSNTMSSDLDKQFFGMSRFVAAQSTLCWDLTDEPFVTFFNVGNGKFFNWKGQTTKKATSRAEWSNIGIQDYLPTWRWWWSDGLLGGKGTVPTGLTAAFAWNAAWFGGSSLRIKGSCSDDAVLNLFKTDFKLQAGDTIKVSYLLNGNGSTQMTLLLGDAEGNLKSDCNTIDTESDLAKIGTWNTDNFVVEQDMELGVIALRFRNTENLDMNLGQLMISRSKEKNHYGLDTFGNGDMDAYKKVSHTNHVIDIVRCEHLATTMHGVDAKVVFRLGEDVSTLEGHYNLDHKVSMFNLYTKMEYKDADGNNLVNPVVTLMGSTTSWAGLVYKSPYDVELGQKAAKVTLTLGVAAVGLDMATESDIKWCSGMDVKNSGSGYTISDDIGVSSDFVVNGDKFKAGYKDPNHDGVYWVLRGPLAGTNAYITEPQYINMGYGKTFDAAASDDEQLSADGVGKESLPYGFYDLLAFDSKEKAEAAIKNKTDEGRTRLLSAYIQIYKSDTGKPKITKFVALDDDDSDDISEVTEETATNTVLADLKAKAAGKWNYHFEWGDSRRDLEDDGLTTLPGAGIKVRPGQTLTMKYEAKSNILGAVSKGVAVEDMALGVKASDLGLNNKGQSFTVAYWLKITRINDKKAFLLNVRNPEEECWPNRAWGWLWSEMDQNGNLESVSVRTDASSSKNFNFAENSVKFETGAWYHMAFVVDAANNVVKFYRNGQLVKTTVGGNDGSFMAFNTGKLASTKSAGTFTGSNTIMLGGIAGKGAITGFDGVVDNFQIYNKALDADAIPLTMGNIVRDERLNGWMVTPLSTLEDDYGLVGFWDFEDAYDNGYDNEVEKYSKAKLLRFNYLVDDGDYDVQVKAVADEASVGLGFPALNEGVSPQDVTENYTVAGAKSYTLMDENYSNDGREVYGDTRELTVVSSSKKTDPVKVKKSHSMVAGDRYVGYAQFTFPNYNKRSGNGYTDITMSVYVAKLTLSNVVGSDEATYKYIYVLDWDKPIITAVDNVKGDELSIRPMKNGAIFTCAEDVNVTVCDISGRIVKKFALSGSEFVPLSAGVYIANGKKILVR